MWFGAMTVHVLGHLVDTYRLAPRDWTPKAGYVPGVWLRRALSSSRWWPELASVPRPRPGRHLGAALTSCGAEAADPLR